MSKKAKDVVAELRKAGAEVKADFRKGLLVTFRGRAWACLVYLDQLAAALDEVHQIAASEQQPQGTVGLGELRFVPSWRMAGAALAR
jgi:hypothetical protein